ncbi:hypothetical protein J6590_090008 [Homalodisca vitripennis]|nr:hypothetical protein J6590_090008 [Homalodisca vitripennis]
MYDKTKPVLRNGASLRTTAKGLQVSATAATTVSDNYSGPGFFNHLDSLGDWAYDSAGTEMMSFLECGFHTQRGARSTTYQYPITKMISKTPWFRIFTIY